MLQLRERSSLFRNMHASHRGSQRQVNGCHTLCYVLCVSLENAVNELTMRSGCRNHVQPSLSPLPSQLPIP